MTERSSSYRHATREEKLVDLGEGPWLDEPDYEEWAGTGPMRGLVHVVLRGPMGNTCGYVGVPPGHPWHSKRYREIDARVHGGVTYTEPCNHHVCHVPAPGEPEALWWIGFDCGHAFDYIPALHKQYRLDERRYVEPSPLAGQWTDRYRPWGYAKQQTALLAWQAAKARRWVEHQAAQADTRHAQHKTKTGLVLQIRLRQRTLQRQRRQLIRSATR